jgi:hypothetical protein
MLPRRRVEEEPDVSGAGAIPIILAILETICISTGGDIASP